MADHIAAKFIGSVDAEGVPVTYHSGIPARDLTDDDLKALTNEQRDAVETSPLYTMAAPRSRRRPDGEGDDSN